MAKSAKSLSLLPSTIWLKPALLSGDIRWLTLLIDKMSFNKDSAEKLELELLDSLKLTVRSNERLDILKCIFDKPGLNFNKHFLNVLLIEAASYDSDQILLYLLQKGANVNYRDEKTQDSALHRAVMRVKEDNVKVLLAQEGSNIHLIGQNQLTPYHMACFLKPEGKKIPTILEFFIRSKGNELIAPKFLTIELGGKKYSSWPELFRSSGFIKQEGELEAATIEHKDSYKNLISIHQIILGQKSGDLLTEIKKILSKIPKSFVENAVNNLVSICESYDFDGKVGTRVELLEYIINFSSNYKFLPITFISQHLTLCLIYANCEDNKAAAYQHAAKALEYYNRSVTDPQYSQSIVLFNQLIQFYLGLSLKYVDNNKAIEHLKKSLELDSSSEKALFELFTLYINIDRFKEAEKMIKEIKGNELLKQLFQTELGLLSNTIEQGEVYKLITEVKELETTQPLESVVSELFSRVQSKYYIATENINAAKKLYLLRLDTHFTLSSVYELLNIYIEAEEWQEGLSQLNSITAKYLLDSSVHCGLKYYQCFFNLLCSNNKVAESYLNELIEKKLIADYLANNLVIIQMYSLIYEHNDPLKAKEYAQKITDQAQRSHCTTLISMLEQLRQKDCTSTADDTTTTDTITPDVLCEAVSILTTSAAPGNISGSPYDIASQDGRDRSSEATLTHGSDSETDDIIPEPTPQEIHEHFQRLKSAAVHAMVQNHNHHLPHHHTWKINDTIYDTSNTLLYKISNTEVLYGAIGGKLALDSRTLAKANIALSKGMVPKDSKHPGVKLIGGLFEIKISGDMRPYTTKKYHNEIDARLLIFDKHCQHSKINKIASIDHPIIDEIHCLGDGGNDGFDI